jgi:hypothetical protein
VHVGITVTSDSKGTMLITQDPDYVRSGASFCLLI